MVVYFAHGVGTTFNLVTSIFAQEETAGIGYTCRVSCTVAIAVGARVRVTTAVVAFHVRVANKVRRASALEGT